MDKDCSKDWGQLMGEVAGLAIHQGRAPEAHTSVFKVWERNRALVVQPVWCQTLAAGSPGFRPLLAHDH